LSDEPSKHDSLCLSPAAGLLFGGNKLRFFTVMFIGDFYYGANVKISFFRPSFLGGYLFAFGFCSDNATHGSRTNAIISSCGHSAYTCCKTQ
jgi:hypothetical protein